jgi:hypothetical protein
MMTALLSIKNHTDKESIMFINGIVIGAITFFTIGIFHPLIIYGEYHFGTKLWPIFLFIGLVLCVVSLFIEDSIFSGILGIIAFSCFWGIVELFNQKKRVERGWFPKKPTGVIGSKNNGEIFNNIFWRNN